MYLNKLNVPFAETHLVNSTILFVVIVWLLDILIVYLTNIKAKCFKYNLLQLISSHIIRVNYMRAQLTKKCSVNYYRPIRNIILGTFSPVIPFNIVYF